MVKKAPVWFPHPIAWFSAVMLFTFGRIFSIVSAFIVPPLLELARRSPRLAWFAILLWWLSPIIAVAGSHRMVSSILDGLDGGVARRPLSSAWTGIFAWSMSLFVSITTSFVMLVIDPPPAEPDLFAMVTPQAAPLTVAMFVWIVLAAAAFHIEREVQRH